MKLPDPVRRWRRRCFGWLVRHLVAALRRCPRAWAARFLRELGRLAWHLPGTGRTIAQLQVQRAFPGLEVGDACKLARRSYRVLGDNLLDMIRVDAVVEFPIAERDRFAEVRARGPVLVLMAHAGAWELVGPELVQWTNGAFGAITAGPHNPQLGAWLNRERAARGIRCFDRDHDIAGATRWLRGGGCLAVLADHKPRGGQIAAPWFGHAAPTTTGPARLASAAGATILPLGIRRSGARHLIGLGTPFIPSGDAQVDAARCNGALEELIRQSPEEWTWFHDRYDTQG